MDIVVGAVGIATDFIPVPGLKPAFGILKFIWDSVQTTSNNRRSLRNLAVSSTELFMAVNRVLTKIDINDHLQDLLLKFQDVLEGIRDFAKEHAEVNLFRLLMRNVDVVGKIEYFQTRLQNLSMAFSIAAYGDLRTQLGRLLEMRDLSSTSIQDQEHSTVSLDTVTTTNQRTHIRDYEPQRVKVSYSESCTVETRGGVPVLASRYDKDMEFSTWGISAGSSTAVTEAGSFDVLSDGGAALWTWSLMKNRITSFDLNPAYTDWRDRMDISFPDDATAASWFNWLQAYATTDAVDTVPQRCEVSVRTTYHCWLQKTPDSIQHRRSGRAPWVMTLGGHSQSSRAHGTHFTYISGNTAGFTKVYRSGDTVVHERSVRADTEEPTTARRYHFETEAMADGWYRALKNCAIKLAGQNEPIRVKRTLIDPRTMQVFNREPVLGSALWPDIQLRHWGLRVSTSIVSRTPNSFTAANVTTTWAWRYQGNQLKIYTTIASHPDWFHSFELVFRDAEACLAWFTYLKNCAMGDLPPTLPPQAEHVSLTEETVCWMQKTNRRVQTRTAMSESWLNLFGQYKSMKISNSHLAITSTSILPHMRITQDGRYLIQERMAPDDDTVIPVRRTHKFPTQNEAGTWYVAWKENLRAYSERITR